MAQIIEYEEFIKQWSALHGEVSTNGIVGGWLKISYRLARLLSILRIGPNALTYLGVVFGGATALFSPHAWAGMFLVFSLVCDGVDGTVAIVTGKASKFGALIDAIADRLTEALWLIAFYRIGVPLNLVFALLLLAGIQEYARARAGSAGVREVGVVTPAERPVRASFLFIGLIAWQAGFAHEWIVYLAIALSLLQFLGLVMVIRYIYQKLK